MRKRWIAVKKNSYLHIAKKRLIPRARVTHCPYKTKSRLFLFFIYLSFELIHNAFYCTFSVKIPATFYKQSIVCKHFFTLHFRFSKIFSLFHRFLKKANDLLSVGRLKYTKRVFTALNDTWRPRLMLTYRLYLHEIRIRIIIDMEKTKQ